MIINRKAVKKFVNAKQMRSSKAIFDVLNRFIEAKLTEAMAIPNGGKKTLDVEVLAHVGVK